MVAKPEHARRNTRVKALPKAMVCLAIDLIA
jgi:hypothetical protein